MARRFPFTASDKGVYILDGIHNFRVYCRLEIEGPLPDSLLRQAADYAVTNPPRLKSIARVSWFSS
jgi:hypothetical protein